MIKVPIEGLIVFFAFFVARQVRNITDLIPDVHLPIQTIDTEHLFGFALVGSVIYILLAAFAGLYKMRIYQSRIQELKDLLFVSIYWFFIYIAVLYLSLGFFYTYPIPRLIVLFSVLIATFLIVLERVILDRIERGLIIRGILSKTKILLVIRTEKNDIIESIQESNMYDIFGYSHLHDMKLSTIPYIGGVTEIIGAMRTHAIDEILIVQNDFTREETQEIFEYARIYGIRYCYVANSFDTTKINTEISFFGKIPVIEIKNI